MKNSESNSLAFLKLLAISSVIIAHIYVDADAAHRLSLLKNFYSVFGSFGVGIFFMLAGFNLNSTKLSSSANFKPVIFLIIPWVFSASLIYCYLLIRKDHLDFNFFEFLLGASSYLYFMSIYVFFYLLGKYIVRNFVVAVVLFSISVAYYVLKDITITLFGSEHLNILLWLPYFILGSRIGVSKKNCCDDPQYLVYIAIVVLGCLVSLASRNVLDGLNYRNIFLLLIVQFIFVIAQLNFDFPMGVFELLTRNTLVIYLWHIPIIGILNKISNLYVPVLHCFSWCIVLLLFYISIFAVVKYPTRGNKIFYLLGINKFYDRLPR